MNPGDKVVCINDVFDPEIKQLYTALPVKDRTYVVRDVRLGVRWPDLQGDVSLLLIGLVNPHAKSKSALEFGFSIDRFRKLEEVQASAREVLEKERTARRSVPTQVEEFEGMPITSVEDGLSEVENETGPCPLSL